RAKAVVEVAGVRADLPYPAVGREQRHAGGVEARTLGGDVDVPAIPRDPSEREPRDERRRAERRLLGTGPRARAAGTTDPTDTLVAGDAAHDSGDRRHQMGVAVRVPGQRKDSPGASQGRLRPDLGRELARPHASAEKPSGELR